MWSWVWWQASFLLLHSFEARAFQMFAQGRYHLPATEINCLDLPMKSTAITPIRIISEGFHLPSQLNSVSPTVLPAAAPPTDSSLNIHEIQKRFDHLFGEGEDLVKEHAKLVQDINSMRQVVFIAPLFDDNKEYEDSIYHEIIETTSTTTPKPMTVTTTKSRSKATSFPMLLLGGASQRQTVKVPPTMSLKMSRPTISLVGSSITPLARHPYPFVGQASSLKPFKICMPPTPMVMPTRRPSLLSRILSFFPSLTG